MSFDQAVDAEMSLGWCFGLTWKCTTSEAMGLWSAFLFYTTILLVSFMHGIQQQNSGTADINEEATRRHTRANADDDWGMLCWLLLYFFGFAGGSLLWVLAGVRAVHPLQMWPLQLLGSAMLVACTFLFIASHVDMGDNWSPVAEQKARHQLVTHGLFRWARHPMYAIFLWGSIGTLLATLNWLIAWIVSGLVLVTFRRIEAEERILVDLFGAQYLEYRTRVSALGPPWSCLGYD